MVSPHSRGNEEKEVRSVETVVITYHLAMIESKSQPDIGSVMLPQDFVQFEISLLACVLIDSS